MILAQSLRWIGVLKRPLATGVVRVTFRKGQRGRGWFWCCIAHVWARKA